MAETYILEYELLDPNIRQDMLTSMNFYCSRTVGVVLEWYIANHCVNVVNIAPIMVLRPEIELPYFVLLRLRIALVSKTQPKYFAPVQYRVICGTMTSKR